MSVGSNIKRIRTDNNLTQEEFGKIADVSAMAVSQWENERAIPRMGAVQRIADHFRIPKSEIIDDERSAAPKRPANARPAVGMPMGLVPLRGRVHAGRPDEPEDLSGRDQMVRVPQFIIDRDPDAYAVEAEGDCMDRVYPEGCTVVVSPNAAPANGSVAVVAIGGADAVMRRMYRTPSTLVLSPDSFNPDHRDIVITAEDDRTVELVGKVVWFQSREEM